MLTLPRGGISAGVAAAAWRPGRLLAFFAAAVFLTAACSSATGALTGSLRAEGLQARRPARPRILGPRVSISPSVAYRFSSHEPGLAPGRLRFRCSFDAQKLHRCSRVLRVRLRVGRHRLRVQAVDPGGRTSALTQIRITIRPHSPPAGTFTVRVGSQPINTASGAGSIWVANYGDGSISRIDESTNRVTATIGIGVAPYGVAFGAGAAWVTDSVNGMVLRIDPASNRIVARVAVGGSPTGLTFGDGALWVANRDGSLERVDPTSNTVTARTAFSRPGIADAVGFGSVWVTTEDGAVFRIDSSTAALTAGPITIGGDVDDVTVGPTAVWAASLTGRSVARIDPTNNSVAARVAPGGEASGVICTGGALLVSLYDRGLVQKVDPQTGRVVQTVRVGTQPRGFTVGETGVWVSNQGSGTVTRLKP